MRPQNLQEFTRRRPFVPYRIYATDGRTYDIRIRSSFCKAELSSAREAATACRNTLSTWPFFTSCESRNCRPKQQVPQVNHPRFDWSGIEHLRPRYWSQP